MYYRELLSGRDICSMWGILFRMEVKNFLVYLSFLHPKEKLPIKGTEDSNYGWHHLSRTVSLSCRGSDPTSATQCLSHRLDTQPDLLLLASSPSLNFQSSLPIPCPGRGWRTLTVYENVGHKLRKSFSYSLKPFKCYNILVSKSF